MIHYNILDSVQDGDHQILTVRIGSDILPASYFIEKEFKLETVESQLKKRNG